MSRLVENGAWWIRAVSEGIDAVTEFDHRFGALYGDGRQPFPWQHRLYAGFRSGEPPAAVDIPTGLGKTSAMAAWLLARAENRRLASRLIYVVDRRAVIDQATDEALALRDALARPDLMPVRAGLGLRPGETIAVSTLRGQWADAGDWLADPARPSIIVGTVDMIGSRLLFEGYGVSRRQRPVHAGLLGIDSLVLLDEAHLVPPFHALLEAISRDTDDGLSLGLNPVPGSASLRLTTLSATGRAPVDGAAAPDVIRLDADDVANPVIARRINAAKPIALVATSSPVRPAAFVAEAMRLTGQGVDDLRVVLFCNLRDDAEKVSRELRAAIAGAKKAANPGVRRGGAQGIAGEAVDRVELLVGARRVHERARARARIADLGFLPAALPPAGPGRATFLVATSAGEVGVDLDADIMIADAVPFERMAQRLGRVNRRGERNASTRVVVFEPAPDESDPRAERARATIALLRRLPSTPAGLDASPAALAALRAGAPAAIQAATTPAPLRPALASALVEAWSMTSLDAHAGRPEVAPWLRGWVDDEPQMTVVFRRHLPVSANGTVSRQLLEAYFEAAPVQLVERLEAGATQVTGWFLERLKRLAPRRGRRASAPVDPDEPESETALPPGQTAAAPAASSAAALLLDRELGLIELLDHPAAAAPDDLRQRARKALERAPDGATLLVWSGFGGLSDGLLDATAEGEVLAADAPLDGQDPLDVPFTIESRRRTPEDEAFDGDPALVLERDEAGAPVHWLDIRWHDATDLVALVDEDRKAVSASRVGLDRHQQDVLAAMDDILDRLGAPIGADERQALRIAARWHDQGKAADRWQKAFRGNMPLARKRLAGEPLLAGGPYAKTDCGRPDQRLLGGYRHELGSLFDGTLLSALDPLPTAVGDLALHLVAAHHGHGRPLIRVDGLDIVPPARAAAEATAVALRFARLQQRIGPWRLAWLEALLRAADVRASKAAGTEAGHG